MRRIASKSSRKLISREIETVKKSNSEKDKEKQEILGQKEGKEKKEKNVTEKADSGEVGEGKMKKEKKFLSKEKEEEKEEKILMSKMSHRSLKNGENVRNLDGTYDPESQKRLSAVGGDGAERKNEDANKEKDEADEGEDGNELSEEEGDEERECVGEGDQRIDGMQVNENDIKNEEGNKFWEKEREGKGRDKEEENKEVEKEVEEDALSGPPPMFISPTMDTKIRSVGCRDACIRLLSVYQGIGE